MNATERIASLIDDIKGLAHEGSAPDVRAKAGPLLDALLDGVVAPELPATLFRAPESGPDDYLANWNHQLWYHLTEFERIHEDRLKRAESQGGDSWINAPKPSKEEELQNQLSETAKVVGSIDNPPTLVKTEHGDTLFIDALFEKANAWDHPEQLAVERDPEKGVAWQGQNPGGDWFWLTQELPHKPLSIRFDVMPISTIKGGLIIGFCAQPVKPGTPFSVASGPKMSDYFLNFNAYHFSVHRGSTGYCNLRRNGVGLLMLASFDDPCPQAGRWYGIEVIKNGPQVELRVDGRLSVCYLDEGIIQPLLGRGFFGLRHFQGFYGWHRNVNITALEVK